MPKIHVIYDPTDKLQTTPLPKEMKVAIMSVDEDLVNIGAFTETAVCMLLDQFHGKKASDEHNEAP